jgi:hypothetical protein
MAEPAPTSPRPAPEPDPRYARTPTIRQAWAIIIKDPAMKAGSITIFENKSGARVTIEETHGGSDRSIDLNVVELRALADHANRIARRVASRPEYRP